MIYNSKLVRKRLPTAFVYLYTQCLFLVVLLLLLLSVKVLSAEFAAVRELSDEKFNGPKMFAIINLESGCFVANFEESSTARSDIDVERVYVG